MATALKHNNLVNHRRLISDTTDIQALLAKLKKRQTRIAAFFDDRKNSFSTYLLDVTTTGLILHNPCNQAVLNRILGSQQLLFNSICSTAPVNFVANRISAHEHGHSTALLVPVPRSIYWIQRREHPRKRLNTTSICEVKRHNGQVARNALTDISIGGLSMITRDYQHPYTRGAELDDCSIIIPGLANHPLKSHLKICSSDRITLNDGQPAMRYGCQFIGMANRSRKRLQLYIQG